MKNLIKEETQSLNTSNVELNYENTLQIGKDDDKSMKNFEEEKIIEGSFTEDSKEQKSLESMKDLENSLQIYQDQEFRQNESITNLEDTEINAENLKDFIHKNDKNNREEDYPRFQENLEHTPTIILLNNIEEKERISKDSYDQEDQKIEPQKDNIEKEEEINVSFGQDSKKVFTFLIKFIFIYHLGRI